MIGIAVSMPAQIPDSCLFVAAWRRRQKVYAPARHDILEPRVHKFYLAGVA